MSDCDLAEARRACADVTDMLRAVARGGPPPRVGTCQRVGTKELVSFSFSSDIVGRLRRIARRDGRSLSNLLGVLVEGAVYRIDFREPGDEWARKWLRKVRA